MSSAQTTVNTAATTSTTDATKPAPKVGKSGKKICCACPDTRKPRDLCVVQFGEEKCKKEIEAHNACLRLDGFDV